jgi:hypothetical protein
MVNLPDQRETTPDAYLPVCGDRRDATAMMRRAAGRTQILAIEEVVS